MPGIRRIRLGARDQAGVRIAGRTHRFPVRGRDTGGRLSISLIEAAADEEASSVRHTAEDVLLCVLEGSLETGGSDGGGGELAVWGVELGEREGEPASSPAPTIVRADQGERFWLAGDEYTIKIGGNMTGGRFCVVHFRIPPGAGPLAHTHSLDEEIFHIVKGGASFWSERGILEGSEGDTVVLPRGIPHAFRNRTTRETEFLSFFSPARAAVCFR